MVNIVNLGITYDERSNFMIPNNDFYGSTIIMDPHLSETNIFKLN